MNLIDWLFILVIASKFCFGQNYNLTKVILEAFEPSGLRASIPGNPGIRVFGFHANVNKEIDTTEPGEIAGDVTVVPSNTSSDIYYFNPNTKLSVGDTVYYWVYVQHNFLGYRYGGKWKVTELRKDGADQCEKSSTRVANNSLICKDSIILEDNFNEISVDESNWIIEQYFPRGPDYEFVVYKKDSDVVFVKDGLLVIKPKLITDSAEINRERLDLTNGCSRSSNVSCVNEKYLIQNPIISGRLVSKIVFQYGDIEIRAKLPKGDWIYPEIYLEENDQKIWIAYARGNEHLSGNDGTDIGGSLLFAGPVLHPREPQRSSILVSSKGQNPFSNEFHVYRLRWGPDIMEFFLDNDKFGEVKTDTIKNSLLNGRTIKLVLGIGVGGINDFPDDFKSGNVKKPWKNGNRLQVKRFYESKNEWYDQTWGDDSQLQIDYVKIRSF